MASSSSAPCWRTKTWSQAPSLSKHLTPSPRLGNNPLVTHTHLPHPTRTAPLFSLCTDTHTDRSVELPTTTWKSRFLTLTSSSSLWCSRLNIINHLHTRMRRREKDCVATCGGKDGLVWVAPRSSFPLPAPHTRHLPWWSCPPFFKGEGYTAHLDIYRGPFAFWIT